MKRTIMLAGLAVVTLSACRSAESAQAKRARDLQLALQEQRMQYPQFASPAEMGMQAQQPGGQWVYVPPGASAPAPAPARQRVTHTKRDAVIGAAAGAVTGAVIGRNVKGAVIGAAAGGVLGAIVGSTVDVDHR